MKLLLITISFLTLMGCQGPPAARLDSGTTTTSEAKIREATPVEAQAGVSKAYSQFIDVRTPEEYLSGHAARAVNIPLDTLPENIDRLEKQEPVYLICETGKRSQKAADILKEAGFKNIINVAGGTAAWREAELPIETKPPHSKSQTN